MSGTSFLHSVPDWKPPKRIIDPEAAKRKVIFERLCRACGVLATDGHHILLRSQGGDDTEDNILPLCRLCHTKYHDGSIGLKLSLDEQLYVLTKLGQEAGRAYMERRRYE